MIRRDGASRSDPVSPGDETWMIRSSGGESNRPAAASPTYSATRRDVTAAYPSSENSSKITSTVPRLSRYYPSSLGAAILYSDKKSGWLSRLYGTASSNVCRHYRVLTSGSGRATACLRLPCIADLDDVALGVPAVQSLDVPVPVRVPESPAASGAWPLDVGGLYVQR